MPSEPIVVVGGGAAGVTCACKLAERGDRVILIEQGPQLGGRAGSFTHPDYGLIDFGQHILMRCCKESAALFDRLGVGDALRFQSSLNVPIATHDTPEPVRARVASAPLPAPLHLVPSLLRYRPLSSTDRARVIPAAWSLWLRSPTPGNTFATWLERHAQSPEAVARFWDPISIAALNAPAASVDAGVAGMVFRKAFLSPHGADLGFFQRPLSELFGAAIPYLENRQGTVLLGTRVRAIEITDGRCVGVRLASGEAIRAASVVSAVPPSDLAALLPDTLEPGRRLPISDVVQHLAWAPIVNLHLWFDRLVMPREQPLFIAVDGPVQAVFNGSALHEGSADHHVVLSQSNAQELVTMGDSRIIDRLLLSLGDLLPATRSARLRGALVVRWRRATFVPEPGSDAFRPEPRSHFERLMLAGDWVNTGWPSTIEGAVRAGVRAAMRVSQDNSRAVNLGLPQ